MISFKTIRHIDNENGKTINNSMKFDETKKKLISKKSIQIRRRDIRLCLIMLIHSCENP